MDLGRARFAQYLHDLTGRVAAHDRVVDHDQALARDHLGQRIELQPHPMAPQLLARLDERPRHIAVLDEAIVLRQAGGPGQSSGGRVARIWHRDHQIRIHRRLAPQDLAHPGARDLEHRAAQARIGSREVDVLEHAHRMALALGDHP